MRHLKTGRILGRTSAHRKALFRNLVTALIQRERIRTTLAKAKEMRSKAEKTITLGKKGTLHARRRALAILTEKNALTKLFGPLAERYASRKGGYTRIIKIGNRRGDDAPMAIIELVDRITGTSKLKDKKASESAHTKKKPPKQTESKKAVEKKEDKKEDKKGKKVNKPTDVKKKLAKGADSKKRVGKETAKKDKKK